MNVPLCYYLPLDRLPQKGLSLDVKRRYGISYKLASGEIVRETGMNCWQVLDFLKKKHSTQ